jgi:hypothetical protein
MHNLFIYDAKEWFFTNIAEGTTYIIRGYDEAVEKLKAKYQSVTRQDRIKQVLYCLTFEEFVEGSGTHSELKTALDKFKTRIVRLTQQCTPASQGTDHQLAHLRRAVIGQSWS